jgi:hypothetical protein
LNDNWRSATDDVVNHLDEILYETHKGIKAENPPNIELEAIDLEKLDKKREEIIGKLNEIWKVLNIPEIPLPLLPLD